MAVRVDTRAALLVVAGGLFALAAHADHRGDGHRVSSARLVMRNIQQAVDCYRLETGRDCPDGLDELLRLQILMKRPLDPWGRPFVLVCPGEHDRDGVDLRSGGPDGEAGTDDDITSWD